jgi:hypothetical protein
MKQYRTIVTLQAPFNDPVEMPYGPWSTDKFGALAALTSALATHDPDDRWTFCQQVRIDIRNVDGCGHEGCDALVVPGEDCPNYGDGESHA